MATDTLEIFGTEYSGVTGIKATDDNSQTKTYIRPQGTVSISSNGTGIDVTQYASADVAVPTATLQSSKSYTVSASGSTTISPDTGYDAMEAVALTVPSGTAGTPSATKGTVSNHSVSVTPSVTNQTGWITRSTKSGTAVSVSASELVSGNLPITANGNNIDCTNYATVSVSVPSGSATVKSTTGTATSYPTSISFTNLSAQPKAFFVRPTTSITVSTSSSSNYYYVASVVYDGTNTKGSCLRMGSTRNLSNISSGYSFTYSGGTLTVSSSAASRSASPGAFYGGSGGGTYELVYVY